MLGYAVGQAALDEVAAGGLQRAQLARSTVAQHLLQQLHAKQEGEGEQGGGGQVGGRRRGSADTPAGAWKAGMVEVLPHRSAGTVPRGHDAARRKLKWWAGQGPTGGAAGAGQLADLASHAWACRRACRRTPTAQQHQHGGLRQAIRRRGPAHWLGTGFALTSCGSRPRWPVSCTGSPLPPLLRIERSVGAALLVVRACLRAAAAGKMSVSIGLRRGVLAGLFLACDRVRRPVLPGSSITAQVSPVRASWAA